jgi:signal transduction histidine kinase
VEHALEECEKDVAQTIASLNIVNEESQRLSRVVSEILSVSEIEVGSFCIHKDDVRLDALFTQLQSDYEAQARDKKITLTFNLPPKLPVLQGDRDKIFLAVHNVLDNALKYTPKQGCVSVTVTVEEDRLCIVVTDTGVGIHEDELEKIFEKFYRSKDKRIHGITGSGLGLPIAREVVRLHGGDLKAASEWDKGSTFTVILPLSEEAKQGEHSSTTGWSS